MDENRIFTAGEAETGTALILVDENSSENSILVTPGACACFTPEDVAQAGDVLEGADILLTQLETNLDVLPAVLAAFRRTGGTAILNPAPAREIPPELLSGFDIITPNEVEASILSGVAVDSPASAEKAADVFIGMGVKTVIITMGRAGVFIKDACRGGRFIGAFIVDALDTTGAGDAFNGAFAAALAGGTAVDDAARYGCAAAALSVTRIGTAPAMARKNEIEDFLLRQNDC